MSERPHPPALPHSALEELLPDVFFVTGSVKMAPLMACSRNMAVIREGERLILVNSMRLTESGLSELDALGKVTDVIRLAGFHGMDDPFYKERYGAKIWNVAGMSYQKGFDATKTSDNPYFEADEEMTPGSKLPLANAKLIAFTAKPSEGLLLLDREGGVLITGDSLQNWAQTNEYFSFVGRLVMKRMGFIKPHNIGPGWIKAVNPKTSEIQGVLDLEFEHLLPAHGDAVLGGAKQAYRPKLSAFSGR